MTKVELQKELKERVKPGIKPSQLRKSKSLSEIPKAQSLPNLQRSKSAQELEPTNSKIEQLESKISALELKLEVSQREIVEVQAEKQTLAEQLKEKQIEELREKLETNSTQELDQSLIARHQNLKDWFQQYQKSKQLDKELSENIDQASTELIEQDQTISSLRSENNRLKQSNQNLTQDLKLSQRLAELRRSPLTSKEAWLPTPSFSWITLALTIFALWIWTKPKE